MERITSFEVDHMKLLPWVYVSRKDVFWDTTITTFDIRVTRPNFEPVMNNAEMHAIEHLWATFLRNNKEFSKDMVYFWPMWCRTWFYILLNWDLSSRDVLPLIKDLFEFVKNFNWDIPWQSAIECWNYLDMNLPMARFVANKFLSETLNNITDENLVYPK